MAGERLRFAPEPDLARVSRVEVEVVVAEERVSVERSFDPVESGWREERRVPEIE